jgi:hypothetical protein
VQGERSSGRMACPLTDRVQSGASLLVHPAIAESCASAIDGVVSDPDVGGRVAAAAVEGPELLRRFAGICAEQELPLLDEPADRHRRRHPPGRRDRRPATRATSTTAPPTATPAWPTRWPAGR